MALHIGIGNFSGAIASNIFRTQDSPRFKLGRELSFPKASACAYSSDGLELMFVGIGFVCVPIAVITYIRINAKRDRLEQEAAERGDRKLSPRELRRLGDRAPDFRYTL